MLAVVGIRSRPLTALYIPSSAGNPTDASHPHLRYLVLLPHMELHCAVITFGNQSAHAQPDQMRFSFIFGRFVRIF